MAGTTFMKMEKITMTIKIRFMKIQMTEKDDYDPDGDGGDH